MKSLFNIILLITLCMTLNPVFATNSDLDEQENKISEEGDFQRESYTRELKKGKKKKGDRNVKVQPNKEYAENIILDLDKK